MPTSPTTGAAIRELDRMALVRAVPEHGLQPGDVGTIVHADAEGRGYVVEFVSLLGETVALVDVEASAVRRLRPKEIAHTREIA